MLMDFVRLGKLL